MEEKRMIVCAVFGGAGSLFILVGIGFLLHWLSFLKRSVRTTAIVTGHVGVDPARAAWPANLLPPVVEFVDVNGNRQKAGVMQSGGIRGYAVGAEVPIRYLRTNPGEVKILRFVDTWMVPVAMLLIGTTQVVVAVLVWIFEVPVK